MTFRPNWKIALFTCLLLPLLLLLGFWQLEREQEKIALQAEHGKRQLAAPIELPAGDADNFQRVIIAGEFDNEKVFLLDNRIHEGVVGYEVIQPFRYVNGTVLVNRGWLPLGQRRDVLPEVPLVQGNVRLDGSIHVPAGEPFLLKASDPGLQWPRVIQSVDMAYMARTLEGENLFPRLVRLTGNSTAALLPNWPLVNMEPEKHRAYAVQWFTMAGVLMLLFLYTSFHHGRDKVSRIETSKGEE